MPTMNVSLPDDLAEFVSDQMSHGYNNQSEVVRDGLRLLRSRAEKLSRLRAALDEGRADIEAGRTQPLTDDLLRDIARRGKERAEARRASRAD